MKEFPDPSPFKKTALEERARGKREGREGEKAAGWPPLAQSLQRPTVFHMQVPLISLDSQTQSWAEPGEGRTAKMKSLVTSLRCN